MPCRSRRAVVHEIAGSVDGSQALEQALAGVIVGDGGLLEEDLAPVLAGLVPEAAAAPGIHVKQVETVVSGGLSHAPHQLAAACIAVVVQLTHLTGTVVPAAEGTTNGILVLSVHNILYQHLFIFRCKLNQC